MLDMLGFGGVGGGGGTIMLFMAGSRVREGGGRAGVIKLFIPRGGQRGSHPIKLFIRLVKPYQAYPSTI